MSQRGFLLAVVLFLIPLFAASSVIAANDDVRMVRVQGNVVFDGKNYPTGDYNLLVNGKVLNIDGIVWLKRGETSFARFAAQRVSVSSAGEIRFVTSDRDLDILSRARTAANIESTDSLVAFRGPAGKEQSGGDALIPVPELPMDPGGFGEARACGEACQDPPGYDPPKPPFGMAFMIMPMDGGGPIAIRGGGTSSTLGERADRGTSITTSSITPGSPDGGTTTTSGGGNALPPEDNTP